MVSAFVGRDAELTKLELLCRASSHGRAGAGLVVGDPGSGKTRLLGELRGRMGPVRSLEIRGYEPERGIAFAAARDALVSLGLDAARFDAGAERIEIFEAALRSFGRDPALLYVDDLHWVDETSAAFCHYVLRAAAAEHRPLIMVCAGRPSPQTREMIRALDRLDIARLTLRLGPLARADGMRLLHHLDPSIGTEVAAALWERSAGSPFWLEQLVAGRATGSDLTVADEMLASLSDEEGTVLALLVAAARPLAIESVAELLDRPARDVAAAIAALAGIGLVVDDGGASRIAHDVIRHAVADRIPPERARRMHERLARWLEAGPDDAQRLLEALHHLELAGAPMLAAAVRLAESEQRRRIGGTGLTTLAAVADAADGPLADRLGGLVGALAMDLGEHEVALRRWSGLLERAHGDAAARAALGASRAALELGSVDEANSLVQRARDAASSPDLHLSIEIEATASAVARWLDPRSDDSASAAERAVRQARALAEADGGPDRLGSDARRAYLEALRSASDAAMIADDPPRMLALADEAVRIAAGHDDRTHLRALTQRALALRFLGRNAEAEVSLRRAWDEARARSLPQAILEVGGLRGTVLLSLGRLADAAEVTRECLELGQRLQEFRPSRVFSLTVPGLLEMIGGEWRRGVVSLEEAAASESVPHYRLHAHVERALILARLAPHRFEEVAVAVAAATADAALAVCRRCSADAAARGAEALARSGATEEAERRLDSWTSAAGDRLMAWYGQRARSALAMVRRDPDAPILLGATAEEARAQGLLVEALWARLDGARALSPHDRDGAAKNLRRIGAEAGALGAVIIGRSAEQELRALGVRTWRRGPAGRESVQPELTEREAEIARLVRRGASNPEIAAELFLSRKTVERHLSNALAKLGVRNRAELAAATKDPPGPSAEEDAAED
jgi:DNA-binding CsgD family transcriptional regulator